MPGLRKGLILVATAILIVVLTAAVFAADDAQPSSVKRIVMIGPTYEKNPIVRGMVVLRANVPAEAAAKSVTFYVDGSSLGASGIAPYKFEWDSNSVSDGEHTLKVSATNEAGQEVWSGEAKIDVANKTPEPTPAPPPAVAPPVVTPPPAATAPAVKPPVAPTPKPTVSTKPATTPAPKPAASTKPATAVKPTAPKPAVAPKPATASSKPAAKPAVVAVKPTTKKPVVASKPAAAKPSAPKPAVSSKPAVAKVKPTSPAPKPTVTAQAPKPAAAPKPTTPPETPAPVRKPPAPIKIPRPAQAEWATYTDPQYGFTVEYPATAHMEDETAATSRPMGKDWRWITFTQTLAGERWYALNVRHITLNEPGAPDKFARYNPYLLSWERCAINGISGFKTVSGRAQSKSIIHRTLLVDGRDVWMLNLIDKSGEKPSVTGAIFKRFSESFRARPGGGNVAPAPLPD